MTKLMRGATPVRMQVAKAIKDNHDAFRSQAVREWALKSPLELPAIVVFNPFDNIAFSPEMSPALGVEAARANRFLVTDMNDGEEEYTSRWNINIHVWVYSESDAEGNTLGPQRASAIRRRDDVTGLVTAIILGNRDFDCDFLHLADTNTFAIDYRAANPSPTESKRYFAGATISFEVQCNEWLSRTPLNDPTEPNEISVEAKVVNDNLAASLVNINRRR